MKTPVKKLILCALFAALCAILSQIFIPLPFTPVMINLATVAVFIAGGLLGTKAAAASMGVYLLLGLVGIPVFSGFSSGPGVLLGPTGGYIAGYITAAAVTGALSKNSVTLWRYCLAMLTGALTCYALGTVWYMYITQLSLGSALILCVLPFLPGDALKILLSAYLCTRLKPVINKI